MSPSGRLVNEFWRIHLRQYYVVLNNVLICQCGTNLINMNDFKKQIQEYAVMCAIRIKINIYTYI